MFAVPKLLEEITDVCGENFEERAVGVGNNGAFLINGGPDGVGNKGKFRFVGSALRAGVSGLYSSKK